MRRGAACNASTTALPNPAEQRAQLASYRAAQRRRRSTGKLGPVEWRLEPNQPEAGVERGGNVEKHLSHLPLQQRPRHRAPGMALGNDEAEPLCRRSENRTPLIDVRFCCGRQGGPMRLRRCLAQVVQCKARRASDGPGGENSFEVSRANDATYHGAAKRCRCAAAPASSQTRGKPVRRPAACDPSRDGH